MIVIVAAALALAASDDALLERLRAIDSRAAEVRSLTADFEQTRHTPLVRKPMTSRGRVAVLGPLVRWDTTEPARSTLAVDESTVRIYYPDDRVCEEYPLRDDLRALTASPLPRLDPMLERFTLHPLDAVLLDPDATAPRWIAFELRPKDPSLAEHVERVRVLVDETAPAIHRLETLSPDAEKTLIVFREIRLGADVRTPDVTLRLPEGTTLSRPLGDPGSP